MATQQSGEIIRRLLDEGFEFVVLGGVAAIAHGASTFTQDLDVAAPFTAENFQRLLRALDGLNPRFRIASGVRPVRETAETLATWRNLYLACDLGALDVLGEHPGGRTYDEIASRSVTARIFGHDCQLISIEDLIHVKESLGREKDRQVAHELRVIRAARERGAD